MDPPDGLTEEQQENWAPPTWRELLGKHVPAPVLVEGDGALHELIPLAAARKAVKAAGIKLDKSILEDDTADDGPAAQVSQEQAIADRAKEEAKRQLERDLRLALLQQIHAKWKGPVKRQDWLAIAETILGECWAASELTNKLYGGEETEFEVHKLTEAELQRFCIEATVATAAFGHGGGQVKPLTDLAVRLRIDPQKIKKDLQAKAKAAGKGDVAPEAKGRKT